MDDLTKLIKLLCYSLEEKYYVTLDSGFRCMQEEQLNCNCLPCDILNQILSLLLYFYKITEPTEVEPTEVTEFTSEVCAVKGYLVQTVFRNKAGAGKQLCIASTPNENSILSSGKKNAGIILCEKGQDGYLYIKPENEDFEKLRNKGRKKEIAKRIKNTKLNTENKLTLLASTNREKRDMIFKIVRKICATGKREEIHSFLFAISLFFVPEKTMVLLENYMQAHPEMEEHEKEGTLRDICKYLDFLLAFYNSQKNGGKIYMDVWVKCMEEQWGFNLGRIVMEIDQERRGRRESYTECLFSSLKANFRGRIINKWRELLELLEKDEISVSITGYIDRANADLKKMEEVAELWKRTPKKIKAA